MSAAVSEAVAQDAILAWIREDLPLAMKMAVTPEHVDALIKRLQEGSGALPASPSGGQGSSAAPIPTEPLEPLLADLERLALAAQKRAPGLWGSDIEKGEGSYGEGDEDRTGFMVPYMETEHGKRLFDAHYCDVAEIHEDYDCDDDGCTTVYAWDEAAREIFNFIAAAQPATVLKLIAAVRASEVGMEARQSRNETQPNQPRDREEG